MKTTADILMLISRFCADIPISICEKYSPKSCCCIMDDIARDMVLRGQY